MFEIVEKSPDRLDIAIKGQVDADAMRAGLDALVQKSDGMRGGTMLYRITDFSLPTLAAIGVELTQLPKLLGLVGKFSKCAVISDEGWIKKAAEIEGALIPGLKIKSFALDEEAAAEAWLAASA